MSRTINHLNSVSWAFVQGVSVTGRSFSGGVFDWLNAFSVMTGVALVDGYALLGGWRYPLKSPAPRSAKQLQ